jgi:hypothetical protein
MAATTPEICDFDKLKELYSSDHVAKAMLDVFGSWQRGQKMTELFRLSMDLREAGTATANSELIRVLRKLDRLGYGNFVTGRRGHPTRFEWKYCPVTVGIAAAGIQPVRESEPVRKNENVDEGAIETLVDTSAIDHRYRLRAEWIVDLRLPVDLTAWEATRLSDFIKTLPFEAQQS